MRVYVDIDHTLVAPVMGGPGMQDVIEIIPRPGAEWFLRRLAQETELWAMSAANEMHVARAFDTLGGVDELFRGAITREDMEGVEAQIDPILASATLTDEEKVRALHAIRPIESPGVMFDDFPPGSWMYWLKATSVGIDPDRWITVDAFAKDIPDRNGLKKAYREFRRRFPSGIAMSGSFGQMRPLRVKGGLAWIGR